MNEQLVLLREVNLPTVISRNAFKFGIDFMLQEGEFIEHKCYDGIITEDKLKRRVNILTTVRKTRLLIGFE